MSNLILDRGNFTDFTSVSNLFIDEYMPKASGEFVKIYLFLLRLASNNMSELSINKIADIFSFTEGDVIRGLKYWEQLGLLSLTLGEHGSILGIRLEALSSKNFFVKGFINSENDHVMAKASGDDIIGGSVCEKNVLSHETSNTQTVLPIKHKYSAKEIASFSKDERVKQLTFLAQTYLGKPLSSTDINSILYMIDGLKLPSDFIEYIMEMCISSGNKSVSCIEKSAVEYYKRDIISIDAAKSDAKLRKSIYKSVYKIFGLAGKTPVKKDLTYISKWSDQYGFSEDIILEACNRTMEHTHNASFPYADSILTGWHQTGVTGFSQIEKLDQAHAEENTRKITSIQKKRSNQPKAKKGGNIEQRSYDFNELEKKLLASNKKR